MISDSLMSLADQLDSTLGDSKTKDKKEKPVMTGKKESIHISVETKLKEDWLKICKDNGLTLTRCISVAFDILKVCVEKDIVELTSYGAAFKKDLEK